MYAPVLCGKLHVYVDLHFCLALLHFSWSFRGSWSPPVCFLQFCMVLPSFLHSLPRLNGLERGVCHLSVPPFARCMHLSCVESSMNMLTFTFGLRWFIFHVFFVGPGVLPCVFYNFAWFCLHFCIVFPDWMVWRGVCAILVCPHLHDVCTCLVWKAPCICWPSLLARAASFFMVFFVGPGVLPCVFHNFAWFCLHFCIVFPDWMVWRGVCHLSVPPFARCMHLSCVESSMYMLTFTFGLRCFIFHVFFVGPGVFQCVFYNFAWFCLHFCIVFPDWMVWRGVCAILVCPHLQDVCTCLVWKAPCICWPSLLPCAASFFMFFSWVLASSRVFSTILHGSAVIFA